MAARLGHDSVVRDLLRAKAVVDLPNEHGDTALRLAIMHGHEKTVRAVLEDGRVAVDQKREDDDCTGLVSAVYYGHPDIVCTLLEFGARVDLRVGPDGPTPLHLAAERGELEMVRSLLEAKPPAEVDAVDAVGDKDTPLMRAAGNGHTEVVELMVQHGAAVDLEDWEGSTALIKAALSGSAANVRLLLEWGAKVDHCTSDRSTALMRAVERAEADMEVVVELIKARADVNRQNHEGISALMLAAMHGEPTIAEALLRRGAEVNQETPETGWTALLLAAESAEPQYEEETPHLVEVFEMLLFDGAEVNHSDSSGCTALMKVAEKGSVEIAQLLLENGADPLLVNGEGQTALQIAEAYGHTEVRDLLHEIATR
uniref:Uncharacterized protein n=1 Tax=Pyramimonas obovata TaxID=1411642 RepID=A0A7S0WJH8_9CHLO|mmetsp:Transcript_2745/g.5678  ORF Transcript_2745/g.5678 Transcript_2745/m.5678 type:complete len:371 (+) Transcript_2745:1-1113(+)